MKLGEILMQIILLYYTKIKQACHKPVNRDFSDQFEEVVWIILLGWIYLSEAIWKLLHTELGYFLRFFFSDKIFMIYSSMVT